MAFTELERTFCEEILSEYIEHRRPPPHVRAQLDIGFRVYGQSVEIFEVRPRWGGPPGETMQLPVAKATYVRSRDEWRLYWKRADLKWHRYDTGDPVRSLEAVLQIVDEDEYGCFWG